jgi:hypothetical protein
MRTRPFALALILMLVGACSSAGANKTNPTRPDGRYSSHTNELAGLKVVARASATSVQLANATGFVDRYWPGVNLGSTTPGALPGELRLPRPTIDRWLNEMGSLGVRVIRVYTILPPDFYDALMAYNADHSDAPLWFIQGVWIPEDDFSEHQDLYRPSLTTAFRREIADAVGAVHGDITIAAQYGHASGAYRADVSQWLLAWSPGIEWDPAATYASEQRNAARPAYHGTYITTRDRPTSTESWLASTLDYLASLEARRGWSRPLTFTNWLTTDPLHHPEEPLPQEDLVSIDAMHLAATPRWPGGFFASYHAYPYYPEFLGLSRAYASYKLHGQVDPYAGYLHALRAHHRGQAVMITEFGVPSGLGLAHRGPAGRDQGGHSEAQAMRMDAQMLRDIRDEGFAGGVLFEWSDEWFKHTWNTQDYEVPRDRAQLWSNPYTNEEHFGVLAQDAGSADITIDGQFADWNTQNAPPIFEASTGPILEVEAAKDESYLYLGITTASATPWNRHPISIGFDNLPEAHTNVPGLGNRMPGADVVLTIGARQSARVWRPADLDPLRFQYGDAGGLGYLHVDPLALEARGGVWTHPALMISRPFADPSTGQAHPVETFDISSLPWGDADPDAPNADARNLIDNDATHLEIRIPWMLLGYSDPSSHRVLVPRGNQLSTVRTERVAIALQEGDTSISTSGFDWQDWDTVHRRERLKAGAADLRATFTELADDNSLSWRARP